MPAPRLNFVPHGPGWPGYRNPVTGQSWSPKTGYTSQGAGMGEFFTMDQLTAPGGAPGMQAFPGSPFMSPDQLVPNSGPQYGPWDPTLATYGMSGMGYVGEQQGVTWFKFGLAIIAGAGLMYFFGGSR